MHMATLENTSAANEFRGSPPEDAQSFVSINALKDEVDWQTCTWQLENTIAANESRGSPPEDAGIGFSTAKP